VAAACGDPQLLVRIPARGSQGRPGFLLLSGRMPNAGPASLRRKNPGILSCFTGVTGCRHLSAIFVTVSRLIGSLWRLQTSHYSCNDLTLKRFLTRRRYASGLERELLCSPTSEVYMVPCAIGCPTPMRRTRRMSSHDCTRGLCSPTEISSFLRWRTARSYSNTTINPGVFEARIFNYHALLLQGI
jgi:hypothetical protein